ncbi:hypothetical protein ACC811_02325 [Rhizobium ruizarguesonis]
MGRYLQWGLMGGAVGMLVATALFPVFQVWVSQFQGLITGLAAVTAAAITIRKMDATIQTMERTDRAAENRHEQTRRLTLRADRLKIERMMMPQLGNLAGLTRALDVLLSDVTWEFTTRDIASIQVKRESFDQLARSLKRLIHRPQWTDAAPLWGGRLTHELEIVSKLNETLLVHVYQSTPVSEEYVQRTPPQTLERTREMKVEYLKKMAITASELKEAIDRVMGLLIALCGEYEIHAI